MSPRRIEINLEVPCAQWVDVDSEPIEPLSLLLGPGETEQFHIFVEAQSGRHEWRLEIPVLVDGKRMTVPVRDTKQLDFVTCGPEGLEEYWWTDDGWIRNSSFGNTA